mgnify:CR=1 FL=1
MNQALESARDDIMQGLGELTDFFGFSPVMGHLYGALLMHPGPLSLDELEEMVAKSKASVSMNMRALERWGMVREVWVKGDRRKYYEAETDFWKIIRSVLETRERREVGVALTVLGEDEKTIREALSDMSQEERALADYYLQRIADMRSFFRFAQLGLEFLLARRSPPSPEELVTIHNGSSEDRGKSA